MAYNNGRLSAIVSTIEGQGPSLWSYITADTLATVIAAGYLSDALKFGMRIGDLVLCAIGTLNTAVYPSSGASTADVGEAADFTAVPQWVWLQVVSFTGNAANLAGATQTIGGAATDKLGFYGTAPVTQPSGAGEAAVTTTAATSTTPYGFSTVTQANAIVTLVNQLRSDLVALGLIKGSA